MKSPRYIVERIATGIDNVERILEKHLKSNPNPDYRLVSIVFSEVFILVWERLPYCETERFRFNMGSIPGVGFSSTSED